VPDDVRHRALDVLAGGENSNRVLPTADAATFAATLRDLALDALVYLPPAGRLESAPLAVPAGSGRRGPRPSS
jgi:hypothetical protein